MRTRLSRDGTVDYQVERSNQCWPDHRARTLVTAGLIAWLEPHAVLDLAAGDGSVVLTAHRLRPIDLMTFVDCSVPSMQRLEQTTDAEILVADAMSFLSSAIATGRHWDVVVLTEFLEHLEDPDALLRQARMVADHLVASSPEMRPGQVDPNEEHLWMFDGDGYFALLTGAGWTPIHKTHLGFPSLYNFGVWVATR